MAQVQLKQTCAACPEQYDAYVDGALVGYIRVRHGYFSVRYPNAAGEEIIGGCIEGDGMFAPHERAGFLEIARTALAEKLNETPSSVS